MVAARLKSYIDCRAFGCCSGHCKGMHFGMTLTPFEVCTQAYNSPIVDNHTANDRIDIGLTFRFGSHIQCQPHICFIVQDVKKQKNHP